MATETRFLGLERMWAMGGESRRWSVGSRYWTAVGLVFFGLAEWSAAQEAGKEGPELSVSWADRMLVIEGEGVPGEKIEVWYLEAYCKPGAHQRAWEETVIPHESTLVERDPDGKRIRLKDVLADGVVVEHEIVGGKGEVGFTVTARNPTTRFSDVQWAQPCVRVDRFTGYPRKHSSEDYLGSCFLYIEDKLTRMPTEPWEKSARYVPGQVWRAPEVSPDDVNPRPLSRLLPSNGLIGCFSKDGSSILATAWEPYQELFQGVLVCLHSDFRIGGLEPGQSKTIRGKLYVVPANPEALLARYRADFPERKGP